MQTLWQKEYQTVVVIKKSSKTIYHGNFIMLNLGWVVKYEVVKVEVEVEEEEEEEKVKEILIQVKKTKDSFFNVKEWLFSKEKIF